MRKISIIISLSFLATFLFGSETQTPEQGWVNLFNGKDLSGWHLREPDGPNGWKVIEGGVYANTKPSTDLMTDREFYNFRLHVEFKIPSGSNSGVYMRDKYEIQIFDSYGKSPSISGCGSLYRKVPPSANACGPAGEWQTFDMTFVGRRLSVFHNGKKIHDSIDVGPKGTGAASDREDGPGPLRLQGDHNSVSFRNVRILPLTDNEAETILKSIQ